MNKPLALSLAAALLTAPAADARGAAAPIGGRPAGGSAGPAATPSGAHARTPKPATPPQVQRPLTRAQLQPTANAEASAVLADLLVRYADGKGETRVDKAISKRFGKTAAKLDAARRLATRWRSAPATARSAVLGRADLGKKPVLGALQDAVASASPAPFFALRPTIPMPPEKIAAPASFSLVLSGIQSIAAHDADGSDELATLTIFATPSGKDYVLTSKRSPADGTISAAAAATATVGSTLYDGGSQGMLVVTVLAEDEGGNAAASLAEAEVMVELAAMVAQTLDGSDRLAVLQTMVDYTVGLQNLGADSQAAARSVASARIESPDWYALWGVDSTALDGVPWKLAIPHTIGGGQYEILLDVPSILPDLATVRVAVDRYWVEGLEPLGWWQPLRTRMTTKVKGAEHTIEFGRGIFAKTGVATYERKVLPGDVPLAFSGVLHYSPEYPEKMKTSLTRWCDDADWVPEVCSSFLEGFSVDLAPGAATSRSATYSTRTDKMTGSRPGTNQLTSKGNKDRIAGIKITVVDVAP